MQISHIILCQKRKIILYLILLINNSKNIKRNRRKLKEIKKHLKEISTRKFITYDKNKNNILAITIAYTILVLE